MTSVDTNILIRLLVADDNPQTIAARAIVSRGPLWIAKTVLLETEWVLRSLYAYSPGEIHDALRRLVGLKSVTVEDRSAVIAALELFKSGLDFADALHLTSTPSDASFVSFDRTFVKRAAKAGRTNVHLAANR